MTILRCFDLANSSHHNLFVMLGFYNIFIKSNKLTIIYLFSVMHPCHLVLHPCTFVSKFKVISRLMLYIMCLLNFCLGV